MKKLWLTCLLITSHLEAAGTCLDADKYHKALDTCTTYLHAVQDENIVLDKRAQDAEEASQKAIQLASDNLFGIPAELWFIGGGLLGLSVGFFGARSLK